MEGDDLRRQKSSVARTIDGDRRDGNAWWHLQRGERRIKALKRARCNGYAYDWAQRVRGHRTGQVCCHARTTDECRDLSRFGILDDATHPLGRSVGGGDMGFTVHTEVGEHILGAPHDRPVVLRTHEYANPRHSLT